jgi:hypothetical protein
MKQVDQLIGKLLYPGQHPRPRYRGDCQDGVRPCPYMGCRYHLGYEVSEAGSIHELWPDAEPPETCALDVAERGKHKLIEIAEILGITRERVRQIEAKALAKLEQCNGEIYPLLDCYADMEVDWYQGRNGSDVWTP